MLKFVRTSLLFVVCLASPAFAADDAAASNDPAPRKIAMVSKAAPAKQARRHTKRHSKPAAVEKPAVATNDLLNSLPTEQIEDAIDNFSKVADKVRRASSHKFDEVICWLGTLYRQMNQMPAATPISSPYVQTPPLFDAAAKAIWTEEGRIKTVVHR